MAKKDTGIPYTQPPEFAALMHPEEFFDKIDIEADEAEVALLYDFQQKAFEAGKAVLGVIIQQLPDQFPPEVMAHPDAAKLIKAELLRCVACFKMQPSMYADKDLN